MQGRLKEEPGANQAPPLLFEYRCAACHSPWPITLGDPKAGLCPGCLGIVSEETRRVMGRLCSENPQAP